jgi:DNA-binding LacI/PurR family transcriptional regulator
VDGGTGLGAPVAPPTRRPTMKDVAKAADVSKALVSIAFRGAPGVGVETRAHIFHVADQIGYRTNRTASMLARKRNNMLGVCMRVRSTFHAELVEDLQAAADAAGYEIVLSTVTRTHDERRAINTLLEFRCEALVLLGPELSTQDLTVLAAQLPVIAVGRRLDAPGVDVVRPADDRGLEQIVDHLVSLGHRRILHVDGGAGTIATDRRNGYLKAMHKHGLDHRARYVTGGVTEQDGIKAADRLLAGDRMPTAIAAHNDHCAIGLLDRLSRAGLDIPGQISLTGYDDSPVSSMVRIDLTTVNQEAGAQARWAVTAAIERLDGARTVARESIQSPRLVVRRTTQAPT